MSAETGDLTAEQLGWLRLLSRHRMHEDAYPPMLPASIERFLVRAGLAHYFPEGSGNIEITFKGLAAIRRQCRSQSR